MKKTEVFSKKVDGFIQLAEGPGGPIVVGTENGVGSPTADNWLDRGWNNSSEAWMDRGWNNSSSGWTDRGWKNGK